MTAFAQQLDAGRIIEGRIARWLRGRGWAIIPIYDTEGAKQAPRLFQATTEYVSPDLLCFGRRMLWVESKGKTVFTWRRKPCSTGLPGNVWQTGIDIRNYNDYLAVERITGLPVWLLFLHGNEAPDGRDLLMGSDETCPSGLFTVRLTRPVDHRCPPASVRGGYGRSGMVYWNEASLTKIAEPYDLPD